MRKYNVYFHSKKINMRPVDKEIIDILKKKEFITKKDEATGKSVQYPVNQLKIIECIIV